MVRLKEGGFIPLTTVGLILLMLSVAVVGYYSWGEHRSRMRGISGSSGSTLSSAVAGGKNDVERQTREVLYDALWHVGKNAHMYDNEEERESSVEYLSRVKLGRRLMSLDRWREDPTSPSDFNFGGGSVKVDLEPSPGGYPLVHVGLPEGTSFSGALSGNYLSIRLSVEDFSISPGARFFLLQDRMGEFGDGLETIEDRWMYAEYATAYAEAWGGRTLTLSEERSRALFQLALASHEIDKFGSTDYIALAGDLSGLEGAEKVVNGYDPGVVVKPLRESKIEDLIGRVDSSLEQLERSLESLRSAVDRVEKVAKFRPDVWFERRSREISDIMEGIENDGGGSPEGEFLRICEDFEGIYKFPQREMTRAIEEIRGSEDYLESSLDNFKAGLEMIGELSRGNPLMEQLYENFTREGDPPGVARQVEWGVRGVLENLNLLEERISRARRLLRNPEDYAERFPSDFARRFGDALDENEGERAEDILSEASRAARRTFEDFEEEVDEGLRRSDRVYQLISQELSRQTREPGPNWRDTYREYPGPGENGGRDSVERVAEKYVIYPGGGTMGGLEKLLEDVRSHLKLLKKLGERFEGERRDLREFELDEGLRRRLREGVDYEVPDYLTREESYELCPPPPLYSDPGLSVYHEVEIKDVEYDREDPLGLADESATPTPIYLWFIDVVLYWAQWDVSIEVEAPMVEEVFDYRNQGIPRPVVEGSAIYTHKPLPFKQKFDKSEFSFRLVVVSLRSFGISASD